MTESATSLLIQNGTLVTPEGEVRADLLARGERIQAIGTDLTAPESVNVLDAAGCIVLPGIIDGHTHIALDTGIFQTQDDWLTGTRAAAFGGVTTVVDFATQFAGQPLATAIAARLDEARDAAIDYALHVMVTDLPPGREGELAELVRCGTPSLKLYTTYRPNYYSDDATLLRLMEAAADLGILPLVHCENDDLVTAATDALIRDGQTGWQTHGQSRPALAEQEAVRRVLFLAGAAGCPVHICHCSTAGSVAAVTEARDDGQLVTCETCPQYLLLDDTAYGGPHPWRAILQPPLRDPDERELLWALVEAGAVDSIVTDHCDYTKEQKLASEDFLHTPGGLPGVETLLPLMYSYGVATGRLRLSQLAELLCSGPARIWGLWPRKGALLPGADADVVVYDPQPEGTVLSEELHHLAGYSPYEGMPVHGRIRATVSRGQIIVQNGRFTASPGRGRFLTREPFDPSTGSWMAT